MLAIWSVLCIGCATAQSKGTASSSRERLDRVATTLGFEDASRISISNDRRPTAHAWRDGRIEVTSGLLRLLDDEELAAAIAHEAGHLMARNQPAALTALDGCRRDLGSEVSADLIGRKLLRDKDLRPSAMARMLAKVRNSPETEKACRPLILERIAYLQSH